MLGAEYDTCAQVLNEPLSAYAASKLKAEKAVAEIAAATGLEYQIVKPSNHTGPGQSEKFAVPGFLRQALEIKAGRRGSFKVGNLDSTRTFSDVRDVVRAYAALRALGWAPKYTLAETLADMSKAIPVSPRQPCVSPAGALTARGQ